MNNYFLKTVSIALATSIVVVGVAFWLVNAQSDGQFGATIGVTAYPHSGIIARSYKITSSTTDNTPATDGSIVVGAGNGVNGTGLFLGGTRQNYNLVQTVFATSTFATTTFGAVTASTGTVYQALTFPFPNLGTDDVCSASLTSAPTSSAFEMAAYIAQATSTTATSSVLLENGSSSAVTVGAGTITVLCFDPAF